MWLGYCLHCSHWMTKWKNLIPIKISSNIREILCGEISIFTTITLFLFKQWKFPRVLYGPLPSCELWGWESVLSAGCHLLIASLGATHSCLFFRVIHSFGLWCRRVIRTKSQDFVVVTQPPSILLEWAGSNSKTCTLVHLLNVGFQDCTLHRTVLID